LHATANEAVFFRSLSAEKPLGNVSGLLLYPFILSWQDMGTNTQHNKLQLVQLLCSGVAVISLHQEAGNHAYMPSNEAHLPDLCAPFARRSHTCFYTVWCAHYYVTHPEVMANFLTKAKLFHCQGMLHGVLGDVLHGFVHGIRVGMSIELMLCSFSV
jgi:hypothetical protein